MSYPTMQERSLSLNATEIKAVMRKDTSCRSGRNCRASYRIPQDESEKGSVHAYKARRGYTRVGGEPCLPEIVFIPAHKERYGTREWRRVAKI